MKERKTFSFPYPYISTSIISLCTEELGTVVEWGCMFGNGMPVSEEPNAERAGVLSFNSMAPLRTTWHPFSTPFTCAKHWRGSLQSRSQRASLNGGKVQCDTPLGNFSPQAKGRRWKEGRGNKTWGSLLILTHILITLLKWLTEPSMSWTHFPATRTTSAKHWSRK